MSKKKYYIKISVGPKEIYKRASLRDNRQNVFLKRITPRNDFVCKYHVDFKNLFSKKHSILLEIVVGALLLIVDSEQLTQLKCPIF